MQSGMTTFLIKSASVCQEKRGKLPLVYQEKLGEKYVLSLHIHLVMVFSLSGLPMVNPCAFLFRSKIFLGRSKTFMAEQIFLDMGQKQNPVVKIHFLFGLKL